MRIKCTLTTNESSSQGRDGVARMSPEHGFPLVEFLLPSCPKRQFHTCIIYHSRR